MFDLDVKSFQASKRIRLSSNKTPVVSIKLSVKNTGTVPGSTTATIMGYQGADLLATFTWTVSDALCRGATTYSFTYTPDASVEPGTIDWSVSFDDADPDVDAATATTKVVP